MRTPVFTPREPSFMGLDLSSKIPRRNPKLEDRWSNVFLHGQIEYISGFDIPKIVDGDLSFQTQQDCIVEVMGEDENIVQHKCILVAWKVPDSDRIIGLIVKSDDLYSLEYALKLESERPACF